MSREDLVVARKLSEDEDKAITSATEGGGVSVYSECGTCVIQCGDDNFSFRPLSMPVEGGQLFCQEPFWELVEWRSSGRAGHQEQFQVLEHALSVLLRQNGPVVVLKRFTEGLSNAAHWLNAGFTVAGSVNVAAPISPGSLKAVFSPQTLIGRALPTALIMGRPNPNLLAQARALGRCGVEVYAVLTRGEPPLVARSSRYIKGVLNAQHCSDLQVAELIHDFSVTRSRKPVLLFAGDYDIDLAARIWEEIRDHVVAVTDPLKASEFSDKNCQLDIVKKAGVPIPESRFVKTRQELDKALEELKFPLIGRPVEVSRKGKFEGKVFVAHDESALTDKLGPVLDDGRGELLVQEYVPGGGDQHYFLLANCNEVGEFDVPLVGRKLLENPKGRTNVGESLPDQQVERLSRKAFSAFGLSGVLGVEFKRDSRDGTFYYIETNFRPDNFVAIAQAAGMNLTLMSFLDVAGCGNIYRPLFFRHVIWQDYSLVLLSKLEKKRSASPSGESMGHDRIPIVDAVWAQDDPLPALVWYGLKVVRLVRKAITKAKKQFSW